MFLKQNMNYFKERKGYTAYKLKQEGMPLTTIQQIFSGRTEDPRISVVIKLAKIYGVSIDDLLLKDLEKENNL